MHILAEQVRSLDETVQAVDLGQSPADVLFLSFSDSDLGLMAAAHAALGRAAPSLRLASLAALRHPYSVDLYLDRTAAHARIILVRLLGGADYWRYGVEELAMLARSRGIALALLPGDDRSDARLGEASTVAPELLDRLDALLQAGGPENAERLLAFVSLWLRERELGRDAQPAAVPLPVAQAAIGCERSGCGCAVPCGFPDLSASPDGEEANGERRPVALVVFYRAQRNAGDTAPVRALGAALRADGFRVVALYVTSLKDPAVAGPFLRAVEQLRPQVIVNCTAFSARLDSGGSLLDSAGVPVIQAPLAATAREAWAASARGLGAADLAMNVVLPEVDGRIIGPVLSFKADAERSASLEFTRVVHQPDAEGIARLVRLARGWVQLAARPRARRRIALVLSNYQGRAGRAAHAVGLDGPASIAAIAADLRAAGYDIGALPPPATLMRQIETAPGAALPLDVYAAWFATLPAAFRDGVTAAWGPPEADPAVRDGAFRLQLLTTGRLTIALQPDRGLASARASDHHSPVLAPRHGYAAFYLWLRRQADIDAMIHLGTHGTLEWLPGKAVALSGACAPAVLTDGLPVIYPFIVNNPGEAAQAKRRIGAVTLGHLTPPLIRAGSEGLLGEIEMLVDEFAAAQSLDPRRARRLADSILDKAKRAGIADAAGLTRSLDPAEALARLDAWLCDVKDMRIGDGLHVYGRSPDDGRIAAHLAALDSGSPALAAAMAATGEKERDGLITALDGGFVVPGPAGAPGPNRLDVLPTGRNLYTVDPRGLPTRTAWDLGQRAADDLLARHVQDHGDWPRRMVIDAWASASMRSGGEDIAQAMALIGVRPVWDAATGRVSGFEVLAPARLGRPRIDVTLRISGLFRDVFPAQIALFDAAVRAVAALDEDADSNPLMGETAPLRIFGAASGSYGAGVSERIDTGAWAGREELAAAYLDASSQAFAGEREMAAPADFAKRVQTADAFVHRFDLDGQDLLSDAAFAAHSGGFAAAATSLGARPALYHLDTSGGQPKVRTLAEDFARSLTGRAINPRWIAGQMRHGYRGAAEIADVVANSFHFAALTEVVTSRHFDLLFDATLGDDRVRNFLREANPEALADCLRVFREALSRGLWTSLRNSVAERIAETEAGLP